MPALSGKLALMPLPAWTPGGRRTSVWGGTMLGIAKTTTKPEAAWRLAKRLYLSDDVAERLYLTNGIISPNRRLWSNAMYDAADPYFGGQAPGRLFIDQAADVPRRSSSPFNQRAKERVRDALTALRQSAGLNESASVSVDDLMPAARRELGKAAESMRRLAARNVLARPTR
ncbi:MAG: hypothetical protein KDB53_19235, partial [Planctomycetes bacterium]|nr:hypothetical protein [Planctomycetota bacterium]